VYGARSVRIEDEVLWAKWKSDVSSFPMFILNFIATNKHHGEASAVWKLESPEVRYLPGKNFITDVIDQTGAIILTTPEGQVDLAFCVEGTLIYGFEEDDDFILKDVSQQKNTQNVKDFACNHLKNDLYPCTAPGTGKTFGEMVDYKSELKNGALFTHLIAGKLGPSDVVQWKGKNERGRPLFLNTGSGFKTADGLGVVLEMDACGAILKWRELWDQQYFNTNYPCVIQKLSQYDVFETNVVRTDQVCPKDLLEIFPILPCALIQPKDQFGTGARFLVGVICVESDSPIAMYGLKAVNGEDLLKCVHYYVSMNPWMHLDSYLEPLRANIEDGISSIADHQLEFSRKPASLMEINLVPGEVCMALLYQNTAQSARKVTYRHNQLAVEYKGWKALEPIMKRDAKKTVVPDSGVVEVGNPKFKWMLLPYNRLVLSLESYKLMTPGETATHVDADCGSAYRAVLFDRQYCSFCLRRYCACEED